jgi:response regulator of citrate/malate metabolism
MTTTTNPLIIKTYKIREDTAAQIDELAQKMDVSQAAVVRYILSDYFKEPKAYGMGTDNPQMIFPSNN